MRILSTLIVAGLALACSAQCDNISYYNSAPYTTAYLHFDKHGVTTWKVGYVPAKGWQLVPHIGYDTITYVLHDGRRFSQSGTNASDSLIMALVASPLDSIVVHKGNKYSTMDMARDPLSLGASCKCVQDAVNEERPPGSAMLLPPVPGQGISAGTLIASGSREQITGFAIMIIGAAVGTVIASGGVRRGATPGLIVGGVGALVGVGLTVDGLSKVARGGDRLHELGY